MNKKYLLSLTGAFVLFLSFSANAVSAQSLKELNNNKGYGVSGCGLGAFVFDGRDMGTQLVSLTLNTLAFQTFAITTGSFNCVDNGGAFKQKEQEVFAAVNMTSLEQEMAAGKGENLNAFANLMGCPSTHSDSFGQMTRKEYTRLSSYSTTPSAFVQMVKESIQNDETLSGACMI